MATILRGEDNFESSDYKNYVSVPTAYHIYNGGVSVSNALITSGFSTTLYTGNGATQSINTGVDMSTQWGNDASEQFGGLVWGKSRSLSNSHQLYDTIRGATKTIWCDLKNAELTQATGLTSFNSNGFSLGSLAGLNENLSTNASWNFQTTHRVSGTTNHGKAYTCHYNPFTGFTIIKYEGSGIARHEIPHHLGRKLGFVTTKDLVTIENWYASNFDSAGAMALNATDTLGQGYGQVFSSTENSITTSTTGITNNSGHQHILYGWANSYIDESNKLIGNYEIGVYQGTGVAGNKVTTRGKPAWIMVKRIDSTGNWWILDVLRNAYSNPLYPNLPNIESNSTLGSVVNIDSSGFTIVNTGADINASGGQYLYMVVYDNDSGSGKSKYPKSTDTSSVQINNALIPLAHGIDNKGNKNNIVIANETITGVTYTDGKNYLYKTDTGYGVKPYEPRYLSSELVRRFAGEQPDYYDVLHNKWFSTDAGSELVSNGTFSSGVTTGWTVRSGGTLSIVNGTLNIVRGTGNLAVSQVVSGLTIGKKYYIRFGTLNNITMFIANSAETYNYVSTSVTNSVLEVIPSETSIVVQGHVSSGTGNIDNVSIFDSVITPTTEITESRNYLNHIVHADANGQVTYVEELPKIEYKDVIKANEYQGKNACTAWVVFNGESTPPTIRDSYNVSSVVRTATGIYDVYFKEPMDNLNYSTVATQLTPGSSDLEDNYINKVRVVTRNTAFNTTNDPNISIQIFGGKN